MMNMNLLAVVTPPSIYQFVIHKLMISCIIGFYVQSSLSVYNRYIETVHANNQTIIPFFNLWSKEVIENISYPSIFNQIDGNMDASSGPTLVSYIISRDKEINIGKIK